MLNDAARVLLLLPALVLVLLGLKGRAMLANRRLLLWLCLAMLVVGAGLGIYGNLRAVHGAYVPARVIDGHVVPGSG